MSGREAEGALETASTMDDTGSREPTRGPGTGSVARPLPLNSRRLSTALLRRVAKGLELPVTAAREETRVLIEGKLEELGHPPGNVQVVLEDVPRGIHIQLQDYEGVFLDLEPEEVDVNPLGATERRAGGDEDAGPQQPDELRGALEEANRQCEMLQARVRDLEEALEAGKERARELWRVSCVQVTEFDSLLTEKDEEVERLKRELEPLPTRSRSPSTPLLPEHDVSREVGLPTSSRHTPRKGKAPPVEAFTGEDPENRLEDWLPALTRAAQWNGWTPDEILMQLAGHLRGRARQEWNLLQDGDKDTYEKAVAALRVRLDPGSKVVAAQDFRHASQRELEYVGEFVRRLEKTFRLAYGDDGMRPDTRDALLFGQLQEGLRYNLMESPAVSGATSYQALCVAAKNEEKRQAALKKRRQYNPQSNPQWTRPIKRSADVVTSGGSATTHHPPRTSPSQPGRRATCWNCDKPGHLAKDCRAPRKDSEGRTDKRIPATRVVGVLLREPHPTTTP